MLKKLNLHTGTHVAFIIAIITNIPRLIKIHSLDLGILAGQILFTAAFTYILWINAQLFINSKQIESKFAKFTGALIIGTTVAVFMQILNAFIFNDMSIIDQKIGSAFDLTAHQIIGLYIFRAVTFTGLILFIVGNINLVTAKQKNELEIEQLKQDNLEAKLKLLKQQISPHFLFNSLSTLKTMVKEKENKNYIMQLSNVYRYLLKSDGLNTNNLVTVKDELEFTQSYLYILKERFEDGLQVSINVAEQNCELLLPPLALQILIENAIKHNIVSIDEPLSIKIYDEEDKFLVVENNLHLKQSAEDSLGIGLQNIRDRYKLINEQDIEIIKSESVFAVKVPLLTQEKQTKTDINLDFCKGPFKRFSHRCKKES